MYYEEPKAEIIELKLFDIICTSDGQGGAFDTEDDDLEEEL